MCTNHFGLQRVIVLKSQRGCYLRSIFMITEGLLIPGKYGYYNLVYTRAFNCTL